VAVDRAVAGVGRVVRSKVDLSNKLVHSFNEVDLVLENGFESALHVVWEDIKTPHSGIGAFLDLRPQQVVVAGQHHLDEVGIRKNSIFVGVEETH